MLSFDRRWASLEVRSTFESSGSSVRSCLLLPDYGMYVNAQQTLSLDLSRKVERVISARRAEVVANSRYVRAQGALQGTAQVKEESLVLSCLVLSDRKKELR